MQRNPESTADFLDLASALDVYLAHGVPAGKLVLGFQGVSEGNGGLYQAHAGMCEEGSWTPGEFDYRNLREGSRGHRYLGEGGFVETWDERSAASFLYHPDRRVFVTHESPRSAALKADYVIRSNFRGVMFWSLDVDASDHELQQVVNGVFNRRNSAIAAPANLRVDE